MYVHTIVQPFSSRGGLSLATVLSGLGGFFENKDDLPSNMLENGCRTGLFWFSSEPFCSLDAAFLAGLSLPPKIWASLLNLRFGSSALATTSSGCFMIFNTSSGWSSIISTVSYTYIREYFIICHKTAQSHQCFREHVLEIKPTSSDASFEFCLPNIS